MRPGAAWFSIWLLSAGLPARAGSPDLTVDEAKLGASWRVEERFFPPDDCAVVEGCVDGSGYRKLLVFTTETPNIAQTDLVLGEPSRNPLFVWSPCHQHYHLEDYAEYDLLDPAGNEAAPGRKQAFCLRDDTRYVHKTWSPLYPTYDCAFQGITRGWADIYDSSLDCQWIDVTGVPNGTYTLKVIVNPLRRIVESNYNNDTATTTVTLTDTQGIPHRPDGRWIPGAPLLAAREGAAVRVGWDVGFCPAPGYNLYWGLQHPVSSYLYDGATCAISTSGSALVALPDPGPGGLVWFTIVGTSGAVEGGHGFDSMGRERPLTGAGWCGIQTSQPSMSCSSP